MFGVIKVDMLPCMVITVMFGHSQFSKKGCHANLLQCIISLKCCLVLLWGFATQGLGILSQVIGQCPGGSSVRILTLVFLPHWHHGGYILPHLVKSVCW
jgi:hypothetical protein